MKIAEKMTKTLQNIVYMKILSIVLHILNTHFSIYDKINVKKNYLKIIKMGIK